MTADRFEYNYKKRPHYDGSLPKIDTHVIEYPPVRNSALDAQCAANLWGVIIGVSLIAIIILVQIFQSTEYMKQMCFAKHPHVVLEPRGTMSIYGLNVLEGCFLGDRLPNYNVVALVENEAEAKIMLERHNRKVIVIK